MDAESLRQNVARLLTSNLLPQTTEGVAAAVARNALGNGEASREHTGKGKWLASGRGGFLESPEMRIRQGTRAAEY